MQEAASTRPFVSLWGQRGQRAARLLRSCCYEGLSTPRPPPDPSRLPLLGVSGAGRASPPLSRRLSDVSNEVAENSFSRRAGTAADSETLQLLRAGSPERPGTAALEDPDPPPLKFPRASRLRAPSLQAVLHATNSWRSAARSRGSGWDCPRLASSGTAAASTQR